jgi:hypothetical protein
MLVPYGYGMIRLYRYTVGIGVALCQLRICVYIYMDLFRWTRRMVNLQNCGHCDQTIQV